MALLNFDATKVNPARAFEPIPGGWYDAKIVDSKLTPTKDTTGTRLNLQFEIIGGEFNGRRVFEGLNIKNKSQAAQDIAEQQLSAICHAVNVFNLTQTEQIHNQPLKIKVAIQTSEGYEPRNTIKAFEPSSHNPAGGAAQTRPAGFGQGGAAQQTRPAATGGRPAPAATSRPASRQAPAASTEAPKATGSRTAPGARPAGTAPAAGSRPAGSRPAPRQAPAPAPVEEVVEYAEQPWEGEEIVEQEDQFQQVDADIANDEQDGPWGAE